MLALILGISKNHQLVSLQIHRTLHCLCYGSDAVRVLLCSNAELFMRFINLWQECFSFRPIFRASSLKSLRIIFCNWSRWFSYIQAQLMCSWTNSCQSVTHDTHFDIDIHDGMKTICRTALLYTVLFPVPQSTATQQASCVSKKQTHVCQYNFQC